MDTLSQFNVPKLSSSNFFSWKFRMLAVLEAKQLEGLLTQQMPEAEDAKMEFRQKDSMARSYLTCAMNDSEVSLVLNCKTAREIWENVCHRYEGNLKRMCVESRNAVNRVTMKPQETWSEYLLRAEQLWQESRNFGSDITEDELIMALLKGLPSKFNIIALQVSTMENPTLNDLRRIFKVFAERNDLEEKHDPSKAYHVDSRKNWNTSNFVENRERRQDKNQQIICFSCGKSGHRKRDCWHRNKDNSSDVEPRNFSQRLQKVKIAKEEPRNEKGHSEKTFCIKSSKVEETIGAQKMSNRCSDDTEEMWKRRIIEAQAELHEKYSEEIIRINDKAEENILKVEAKLEEVEETLTEEINKIKVEAEEKIKKANQEKEFMKNEFKDFLSRLFPNINLPENGGDKLCLSEYEGLIRSHLEEIGQNKNHNSQDIDILLKEQEEKTAEVEENLVQNGNEEESESKEEKKEDKLEIELKENITKKEDEPEEGESDKFAEETDTKISELSIAKNQFSNPDEGGLVYKQNLSTGNLNQNEENSSSNAGVIDIVESRRNVDYNHYCETFLTDKNIDSTGLQTDLPNGEILLTTRKTLSKWDNRESKKVKFKIKRISEVTYGIFNGCDRTENKMISDVINLRKSGNGGITLLK